MQQNAILLPLKGAEGTVEQVCISIFDVTDAVQYQNELLESRRKVEELSRTDELTQIINRRHLMSRLNEELSRSSRDDGVLSVILLDVDHFKNVNDQRGHLCGDYALRELASILQQNLRQYDILGRYGGEEFGIVLPRASIDDAKIVAERLRTGVEKYTFEFDDQQFHITISLGLASTHCNLVDAPDNLFRLADECLYKAKDSGRNCVLTPDFQDERAS